MKKKIIYLLFPVTLLLLVGCSNNNDNNISDNNSVPLTNKSTQNAVPERVTVTLNNVNTANTEVQSNLPQETELSSFSTNILTSDPNRNNNIQLTCSTLNDHIVSPGETFSFTNLIGKSTSTKGYKEANIISTDGDTIKGLGGGNCQVSSTLYNAVSKLPELEIIERHNHGAEVYYVPIGQDAAVAYGSLDFKFKNNFSSSIKIYATNDDKTINIRISRVNY